MSEDATAATLLGPGIWTRQGPATLVVRENAWMVLVPGLRKQVTEAAWELLGRRPAAEELLDQLVEAAELGSADKLAALLFCVRDGDGATLGVKGTTPLAVHTADGVQQIVGSEEEPFVLTAVESVRRVAFGDLPPEEPVGAPRIVSGIVPVRGFVDMSIDPAQLEEGERRALAEQVEQEGRSIETEEAKRRRAERAAATPTPKPAASSRPATSSSTPRTPAPADRPAGPTRPAASPSAPGGRAAAAPPPAEEPAAPNLFTGLFGDSPAPAAPGGTAAAAPGGAAAAAPAARPSGPAGADAPAPSTPPADEGTTPPPPPQRAAAEAPPRPAARRLVSSSLFDRRRTARAEPPAEQPPSSEQLSEQTLAPPPEQPSEQTEVPAPSQPSAQTQAAPSGDLENSGAYDDLFGKTVLRRIEDAAVRRGGEDEETEHGDQALARPAADATRFPAETRNPGASSADEVEEVPAPEHTAADFIDWVPGVGRTAPEIAQAAARRAAGPRSAPPAYPQVHLGERPPAPATGSRPEPAAPRPAARPASGVVALPGLVCHDGHANPPDRTACRVCAAPLSGPARTVARPPLGTIRSSTGERFVLDRSTIVGRRPRASRVSAEDVPQLITVPSPQQDISRTHLELRLEGWHVLALDLATTNGTTLHRAGHEPLRLRPRDGVLLRDGDVLDLGDGVHLTYGERP